MSLASPWAADTVLRLSEFGHDVHVIDFDQGRQNSGYLRLSDVGSDRLGQAVAGIHKLTAHSTSQLRYALSAGSLGRLLRSLRIECLLSLYGGGFATLAHLSGFRPYVVYVVGSDVLLTGSLRGRMTRMALHASSAVFANGNYLAEQTRKLAPRSDVTSLLLGVDVEKFRPATPPASPIRILCTRGFLPVYNNEYLVQALSLMPESLPEFTVTFASTGPTIEFVQELAAALPERMRRRIEFKNGVSSAEMVSLLQNSHIYVSLSRSDGTSTSLLEALSCGLYPILSAIPQNHEWISAASRNGALVPLDAPMVLASALARAICADELRRTAGEYNRQQVIERADSRRTMRALASGLEQVIQNKRVQ